MSVKRRYLLYIVFTVYIMWRILLHAQSVCLLSTFIAVVGISSDGCCN